MLPIQLGLSDFLSTAISNTSNLPTSFTGIFARGLGIVFYIAQPAFLMAIIYYGVMYAIGDRQEDAKRKLRNVVIGFIVVFIAPRLLDWIAGIK